MKEGKSKSCMSSFRDVIISWPSSFINFAFFFSDIAEHKNCNWCRFRLRIARTSHCNKSWIITRRFETDADNDNNFVTVLKLFTHFLLYECFSFLFCVNIFSMWKRRKKKKISTKVRRVMSNVKAGSSPLELSACFETRSLTSRLDNCVTT